MVPRAGTMVSAPPQKRARGAARDGSPHRSRITNPSRPTPPDEAGLVFVISTPRYAPTENGICDPLVSTSLAARLTRSPRAQSFSGMAAADRASSIDLRVRGDIPDSCEYRVASSEDSQTRQLVGALQNENLTWLRYSNQGASRSPNAWVGRHPYVQGVAACVASRPAGRRALPRGCQEIVTGDLRPAPCRPRPRCLSSTSAPSGGAEPGIRISC